MDKFLDYQDDKSNFKQAELNSESQLESNDIFSSSKKLN